MELANINIYIDSYGSTKEVVNKTISNLKSQLQSEFNNGIINLLYEIDRELRRLIGNHNDLTLLSLNLRNIFELYLTTRYVFDDSKAFSNWIGQLHKDNVDILEGFKSLLSKKNIRTEQLDAQRELVDSVLADGPYKSKGPFNIKDIARKYGYENDYDAIHKLCSKLVHPTSYKVNSYQALTANDNYFIILMYVAVFFCEKIEELCHDIENRIKG